MPGLGIFELIIIFSCLLAVIAVVVVVAVLLLRTRPAVSGGRDRRDENIPELMTPDEVAAALRVDVETVEKLIQDGKLPALKVGDDWRISRANVITFVNAGRDAGDG